MEPQKMSEENEEEDLTRRRLLKLAERQKIKLPRGKVIIIKDRCKGCGFCIEFCPQGVLVQSEEFNALGYHPPKLVEEPPFKVCINCSFCTSICPEFAIFSIPLEEEEEKEYG